MPPLAEAFVRIRPDGTGFGPDLLKEINKVGGKADDAGRKIGNSVVDGMRPPLKKISRDVATEVTKAGAKGESAGEKAGDRVGGKITDGVKGQLGGLAAVVGGAIGGIGIGEAVAGLFERGNVGAKVAGQLGSLLPKETAAEAGRAAAAVYADNFGENLDDIGAAIVAVNQNLPDLELSIDDAEFRSLTEKALTIRDLFGEEVPAVTRAAGQLMRTGLVKDAGQAFDLITSGFQQGLNKGEDFLDTLNEYGTQFRKLGLSGTDALGLIQQGLQGGARDSDIVADAIKEFSIRAVDGSKTTADAFKALHLPVQGTIDAIAKGGPTARAAFGVILDRLKAVKNPADQAQLAVDLFGTQSEDLGKALLGLDLDGAADGMGKVGGAADRAGAALSDSAGAKVEAFKRGLQTNLVDFLGGTVIPKLQEFVGWVRDNSQWLLPLAAGLAAGAVAWKAYTLAQLAATFAAKLFANEIKLSPIGIFITVLVGLGVALVTLWKTSETFRNIVKGALAAVATAFRGFRDVVFSVWNWIRTNWPLLLAILTGPIGIAVLLITRNWDTIKRGVKSAYDTIAHWFGAIRDFAVSSFRTLLGAVLNAFSGIIHGAANAFGWVPGLGGKLKEARDAFDRFKDRVLADLDRINGKQVTVTVNAIVVTKPGGPGRFTAYADGGDFGPGLALVGEEGPELAEFRGSGHVYDAATTRRMLSGQQHAPWSNEPIRIEVPVYLDRREIGRAVARYDDETAREGRG